MLNLHKKLTTLFCTAASMACCSLLFAPKTTATTLVFTHVGSWVEYIEGIPIEHWHWQWTAIKFWPGDLEEDARLVGLQLFQGPEAIDLPTRLDGDSTAFNNTMHPDGDGFETTTKGGEAFWLMFDEPIEVPIIDGLPWLDLRDRKIIISSPLDFDDPGQILAVAIDDRGHYIDAGINENPLDPHEPFPIPDPSTTPALLAIGVIGTGSLLKSKFKKS